MAIMGPTQLAVIEKGVFDRPTLSGTWSPTEARAKTMTFDEAVAAEELSTVNLWAGIDATPKA
jgi:hypothetical protein